MPILEIPKDEWREFCDTFSRQHQGWLADVQILTDQRDRKFEAKGLPFRGVTFDDKENGKSEVSIFINQTQKTDITHTISQPSHIRMQQTENGADQGFEVEAQDGTKAIVRFKNPARSELLDRI